MAEDQSKRKAPQHLLIGGNDEYSVKETAREFVARQAPEDPMNLEVVDGRAETVDAAMEALGRTREAVLTLPFFGGAKLVHLKSCTFLADTVVGRSESVQGALAGLLKTVESTRPEDALLVISAIGMDRRKSFYKAWQKAFAVEQCDLPDISARGLHAFVADVEKKMREAGLKADAGVAERLVELLGNDMRAIHTEIEKLKLYLMPGNAVTEDDLREIVSQTRELLIWELNDAVTGGDASRTLRIYHQLQSQGISEVGMLMVLGGHLRLVALTIFLKEQKQIRLRGSGGFINAEVSGEAARLLPTNKEGKPPAPFRLARIMEQAGDKPSRHWFGAIDILHQTHLQLVSGGGGDRGRMFETALMRLCQR